MRHTLVTTNQSSIKILGVKVDNVTLSQLLAVIQECIDDNKKEIISYVNIHALNIAYSTPWFRHFLNTSTVTFCDGIGVRLAAHLTRQNLAYRYTPPDFIEYIAEFAHQSRWKIFFLGAKPGIAQRAADKLRFDFLGLQIETHNGYFDKTKESIDNERVLEKINNFHPQILVLGFGMPLQERWIKENINDLQINVAFPAGALFDYLAGEVRRAPRWMTDNGFEWFGRLIIEPRRLWKRYVIGNPLFFLRIFVHHILNFPLPN